LRQGNAKAAIAEQQEAIRLDPKNARAYGSLAHALQAANRGASTSAVRPAGESPSVQAALRSVELDPACAECHGTLGFFLFYHDWQFQKADEHFQTAIRLDPHREGVRPSYAMLLAVTGRPEQAIAEVDVGLAREPYRLSWIIVRASALYYARRYDEAIATADRALSIANTDRSAWDWRSKALFQLGRGREALHALAQELFADQSAALDVAVRSGGVDAGLRKALELTDDWRGRIEHSWRRAAWRALLDDGEGALEELERACEHRRLNAINFGADPVFDKLRSHPRFQQLLARTGLDGFFKAR
jgi:tetratricopeptide (TPR) repeat protein